MTINCKHWSPLGNHGACLSGYYGGRPSIGTCTLACKLGANPVTFERSEVSQTKTHQAELLSWDDLRAQIGVTWPDWIPEFDSSRKALDGCSSCTDRARRARWQQRIKELANSTMAKIE